MNRLLFILSLVYCLEAWAEKLIILHTNDHHGRFAATSSGDYGLAAQATLVKELRAKAALEGAHVLLFSSGDINTGTAESNLFLASPDIEGMNAIGYEAMAIGNHEFDNSLSVLRDQQKLAQFEFLSANITDTSGKLIFKDHITKQVGGVRIAVVGITTPDTPLLTVPKNTEGLVFESPFEKKTRTLIQNLKKEHDLVIVLSHLGFYPDEQHGANFPGDITLAKKIPEIDVIIGSHTHTELQKPVQQGKTLILRAKEGGQFLGKLELDVDPQGIRQSRYDLLPVKGLRPDPGVEKILRPYLVEAEQKFSRKVGTTAKAFAGGRGVIDANEHPLGNLVAEAQKDATQVDIAIVDSKGIRTGLPEGQITMRELINISPFGNSLVKVEVTGEELWKTMQKIHDNFMTQGQQMYFSKGFEVKISDGKISELIFRGEKIPPTGHRSFKITMNHFLGYGGSGFPDFRRHPKFEDTGIKDVEALEAYLKKKKTLDPEKYWHRTYQLTPCGAHFLAP